MGSRKWSDWKQEAYGVAGELRIWTAGAVGAFRGLSNTQGSHAGKDDKKSLSPSHRSVHHADVEAHTARNTGKHTEIEQELLAPRALRQRDYGPTIFEST
jgi:hypothetical protein